MEAVPILHDSTDAYISALALGANSASNSSNLLGKDWPGLSDAAAALIAKNYTRLEETDPLRFKAAGAALGAKVNNGTKLPLVDPLLSGVEDKLVSDFNNGGKQKLSEIADVATFGKASDTALIQELNDRFGQYNVEFTGKSIAPPSRFSNAAAVITRAITGVSLSATAINFAPCLVSISPTVASASFEFINLQPQIIATNLRFATYNAQGVNIQVRKFLISRFISRPLLLASLSLSLSPDLNPAATSFTSAKNSFLFRTAWAHFDRAARDKRPAARRAGLAVLDRGGPARSERPAARVCARANW